MSIFRFKSALPLILASILFGSVVAEAQAPRIRNSDDFVDYYCVNIRGRLNGLQGLVKGIQDLLASISMLNGDLLDIDVNINPPSLCIPDINFGANLNVPGLDDLAKCLGKIKVQVQTPDLGGMAQCIADLVSGGISFSLPNFDAEGILSCLGNIDASINLPAIAEMIRGVIQALAEIISSLKNLSASFTLKFNDKFFVGIQALAKFCSKRR